MTGVLPGEEFLNEFYIDQELRAVMENQLYFNGILPQTDTTERSVVYDVIKNTASKDIADGTMTIPMPAGEEAALTELKMTNISEMKGKIPKIGYQFNLSEEVLSSKARTISELDLRTKKAGYGMAYAANILTVKALSAGAKSSGYSPAKVWNDTSGKQNPINDITSFSFDFINKGYPNRALNYYMNQDKLEQLAIYCNNRDTNISYTIDPQQQFMTIEGIPSLAGMKFWNVFDEYTAGHFLTLDTRPTVHPGAEILRYIDPKHGVQVANPDNQGTPDYTGICVNVDQETKNPFGTTVEVWMNMLPIVKIGDVIMDGAGI
jgi:hypothetical protein